MPNHSYPSLRRRILAFALLLEIVMLLVVPLVVASPMVSEIPRGGGPLRAFTNIIMDARRHLVAAAAARSISIFGMYPVDTIKTRIQMEQDAPFRLAGIYGGVSGSLLGQVPYGVLTFGSYEVYKKALLSRFPNVEPIFLYALSAIMGDLTGSGWLCPSEVVKQQMQAGMYASTGEAVRTILKKQGFAGKFIIKQCKILKMSHITELRDTIAATYLARISKTRFLSRLSGCTCKRCSLSCCPTDILRVDEKPLSTGQEI